jgi:hypothetical protein
VCVELRLTRRACVRTQVSSSLNYSTSVSKVIEYYTKLARKERDTSPYVPLNTVIKLFINYWTRRCASTPLSVSSAAGWR